MKISIRADASAIIGTGHVMRCLALARELRARDHEVSLLYGDHPDNPFPLTRYAKQSDVTAIPISPENRETPVPDGTPLAHNQFLSWNWEADAAAVRRVIGQHGHTLDWLIVDHYALDARWERAVRPLSRKLMVIDDLADRHHACDLLVDQNRLGPANPYALLVPADCRVLLGPRFALLRREFQHARTLRERHGGPIRRLLIFFGGVDQKAVTLKALEAVRRVQAQNLHTDVVVGAANPAAREIQALAGRMNNVHTHLQVNYMAELMGRADLMLGAGGTTTWERCAAGLPSLVISVADNQEFIARSVAEKGVAIYLGKSEEVSLDAICRELRHAMEHPEAIHKMGRRASELADGQGTQRVSDYLTRETAGESHDEHPYARSCTT